MESKFDHHFVTAPDGGRLSYYSTGHGPGVIVLHGAVCYGLNHAQLAKALRSSFTVYLPSRRGRGRSDTYPDSVQRVPVQFEAWWDGVDEEPTYQIGSKTYMRTFNPNFSEIMLEQEASDLNTLILATGAEFIIGMSCGALIVLNALLSPRLAPALERVRKVILWEPPLFFSEHETKCDLTLMKRFEREYSKENYRNSMSTAVYLAQLGPWWMPRWLLNAAFVLAMRSQEQAAATKRVFWGEDRGNCTMKGLRSLLWSDFAIVEGMMGPERRFASLADKNQEVLLLRGSKSPVYMKESLDILAGVANMDVGTVWGVGHEALCNKVIGGQPAKAVPVIRDFFLTADGQYGPE